MRMGEGIKLSDELIAKLAGDEVLTFAAITELMAVAKHVVRATVKQHKANDPDYANDVGHVRAQLAAAHREIDELLRPYGVEVTLKAVTDDRLKKTAFEFRFCR